MLRAFIGRWDCLHFKGLGCSFECDVECDWRLACTVECTQGHHNYDWNGTDGTSDFYTLFGWKHAVCVTFVLEYALLSYSLGRLLAHSFSRVHRRSGGRFFSYACRTTTKTKTNSNFGATIFRMLSLYFSISTMDPHGELLLEHMHTANTHTLTHSLSLTHRIRSDCCKYIYRISVE